MTEAIYLPPVLDLLPQAQQQGRAESTQYVTMTIDGQKFLVAVIVTVTKIEGELT